MRSSPTRVYCKIKRRCLSLYTAQKYKVKAESEVNRKKETRKSMFPGKQAHVIVIGNEKGGSGKTTTAMHITCALLHEGFEVGVIDLDLRQRSLTRYMENRLYRSEKSGKPLLMPRLARVRPSENSNVNNARAEDISMTNTAVDRLIDADFIVIDCPGSDTAISRAAHARADTVITPLNDSFIDFDMLAHVDPDTLEVIEPSLYADMIWESRKLKARENGGAIDWVVMRNRLGNFNAKNKERLGGILNELSKRFGFRTAPGFHERIIYRELFLNGLTLLDLTEQGTDLEINMSHISARQEVRNLLTCLNLPHLTPTDKKKELSKVG